jgi:hypothetical protein
MAALNAAAVYKVNFLFCHTSFIINYLIGCLTNSQFEFDV